MIERFLHHGSIWVTGGLAIHIGIEAMTLPGRKQTFAIENCRDMLNKLSWEIEHLEKPMTVHDATALKHTCFNAAVTAWQIADWGVLDANEAQKKTSA